VRGAAEVLADPQDGSIGQNPNIHVAGPRIATLGIYLDRATAAQATRCQHIRQLEQDKIGIAPA
jgi:hypothetical protein